MLEIGRMLISGTIGYFKDRQEIKKVKVAGAIKVIAAEADAKAKRLDKEADQDYSLNQMAVENMKGSWKDEFILILISIPLIMLFTPKYQTIAISGFAAMSNAPVWYQVLVISIFFSIYGLRDILKLVLSNMMNKFGGSK